jgi:hypothetical protein
VAAIGGFLTLSDYRPSTFEGALPSRHAPESRFPPVASPLRGRSLRQAARMRVPPDDSETLKERFASYLRVELGRHEHTIAEYLSRIRGSRSASGKPEEEIS